MITVAKQILLVEDNPNDEELTLRAFKKAGLTNEVIVARDGQAAIDVLFGVAGTPPLAPAVVLLDLKLPKLSGLEVLKQVRAHPQTRLLPVVILTSSNQDRDLLEGYSNGCNSYVVKPVAFEQFVAAVSTLGLYWALTNELPRS